jgi:ribonucleoside-diphosphate reductase alpha chain
LTTDDKKEKPVSPQKELGRGFIYEINNDVVGKKRKLTTGCGSLHCIAFFDPFNGDLLETYLSKGSTGGCNNFMVGLSRMISLSARAGCDIKSIINQLDSCGVCPSYAVRKVTAKDTSKGSCCPMAIGNALLDMHKEVLDELGLLDVEDKELNNGQLCPECQEQMVAEGGCVSCKACGWSKCS